MKNFLSMSALGCVMLWVAGCANSPATRFYVLSSPPDMQQMAGKTDDKCPAIGIGPVIVPAHLAKPQIATSASENEILYAPFDQWAQPLPDNFSNILVENLSKLVCNKALYQFPRTGGHEPDYRVRVEIISMIGNLDSKAFMEIWWAVSESRDKRVIHSAKTRYSEPVQSQDYQGLVRAYSKILATFSRDIAKAIPNP